MWIREKILAYIELNDVVEIMLENGFIWRGKLLSVDEDVVILLSSLGKSDKIVNICISDISVINILMIKNISDIKNILSKKVINDDNKKDNRN